MALLERASLSLDSPQDPLAWFSLSHLWVLQQGQQVSTPSPPPFPVSPAPTSPVVGPGSPQRVRHSLPAAAAVSKSGSSSAPGPGQPPAPRQSPAGTWRGPVGRKGLSQGHTLPPHPALEGRALFLTSLRSNLHPSTDLRPSESALGAQSPCPSPLLTSLGPVPLAGVSIRLCKDTEGRGRDQGCR